MNAGVGCLSEVTSRILVGWEKFKELSGGIVWKEMFNEVEGEGV